MDNKTTSLPTTAAQEKEIPFWMVVVWCVAGFLAVTMIIVGIYYSYFVCCQTRKKRKNKRPHAKHQNLRHPVDIYPRAFIEQLHDSETNSRAMFSPSFVDNMRIPRAMEVKIIESVNSINNTYPLPQLNSPCPSPKRSNSKEHLSPEMFSLPKGRMPPSRQQSFRYSNMTTEESNERIYREKMLVSELREKLRHQNMIDE